MSAYVAGFLSAFLFLFLVAVVGNLWLWAFDKHHGIQCGHCDKVLGSIGENWQITGLLRWKVHYLRYWYRSRPNWTCKKERAE